MEPVPSSNRIERKRRERQEQLDRLMKLPGVEVLPRKASTKLPLYLLFWGFVGLITYLSGLPYVVSVPLLQVWFYFIWFYGSIFLMIAAVVLFVIYKIRT